MPVNLVSKDVPKLSPPVREEMHTKWRRITTDVCAQTIDLILQLKRCSHRKKVVLLVVGEPETIIVYFFLCWNDVEVRNIR